MNQLQLAGQVAGNVQVRYSPGGIGHAEFWLAHRSKQYEGQLQREVYCKIRAVVSGDLFTQQGAQLQADAGLMGTGFLSVRQLRNGAQEMIFYIQHFELKEIINDQETSTDFPLAEEIL